MYYWIERRGGVKTKHQCCCGEIERKIETDLHKQARLVEDIEEDEEEEVRNSGAGMDGVDGGAV